MWQQGMTGCEVQDRKDTLDNFPCHSSHQPVCQPVLADGEQQGGKQHGEVTAGVGPVTRCFWRREMYVADSSGLANLLYFLQLPKG